MLQRNGIILAEPAERHPHRQVLRGLLEKRRDTLDAAHYDEQQNRGERRHQAHHDEDWCVRKPIDDESDEQREQHARDSRGGAADSEYRADILPGEAIRRESVHVDYPALEAERNDADPRDHDRVSRCADDHPHAKGNHHRACDQHGFARAID